MSCSATSVDLALKAPPPMPPMPSTTGQMAKKELLARPNGGCEGKKACSVCQTPKAKSKPPPPEPPGGERFAGPLTREVKMTSSGPTLKVVECTPSPPGSCAVPSEAKATCQTAHFEEPLISLKSEDSLRYEDLRRNLSEMATSLETAGASADWSLKKEEVDELLFAGVATGSAAPVSSEDNPVNHDAPPFNLSEVKPESLDRLDYNLNAFKSSSLSNRFVEDGEPANNLPEVKIESDTVRTVVPKNFETL